jgi:hypothetical protein
MYAKKKLIVADYFNLFFSTQKIIQQCVFILSLFTDNDVCTKQIENHNFIACNFVDDFYWNLIQNVFFFFIKFEFPSHSKDYRN